MGRSRDLLCLAGSAVLCVLVAAVAVLAASVIGRGMDWLYEVGFLSWLCDGNDHLLGVSPLFVIAILMIVSFTFGPPAYRRCRAHRGER